MVYRSEPCENKTEKAIVKALRFFDTIPYNLLERFAEKISQENGNTVKRMFRIMLQNQLVNYDSKDKCYKVCLYLKKDISKIAMFATYLELAEENTFKLCPAEYPFDYIFEDKKIVYQIINFEDNGLYKLNFRRMMQLPSNEDFPVIPVIVLVNNTVQSLNKRDDAGNLFLVPKEDFLVSNVTYIPSLPFEGELDKIAVSIKRYKGGTLNEIKL